MVDSRTPRSDECGAPGTNDAFGGHTDVRVFRSERRTRASPVARSKGCSTRGSNASDERAWSGAVACGPGDSVSARRLERVAGCAARPFHRLARKKITATRKIARNILTRASRANDARRFEPRARASRRIQTRTRALPSCARRRRRASRARRPVARRIPALLLLRSLWMRRRPPRRPLPRA